MPYEELSPNIFNCSVCETRCDGKTVAQFDFENDVRFSEQIEQEVIDWVNTQYPSLIARKTQQTAYPDIEIARRTDPHTCIAFLEIKGQARTFMAIANKLPASGLQASETVALNWSDLERYCLINQKTKVPLFLVWCLLRRPCLTGRQQNGKLFFYQNITILQIIKQTDKNQHRKFRRKTGKGDVINGTHKGVTVNYHFSVNELIKGLPDLQNLCIK